MSERLLYEIQGTSALACSKSSDRVERIIDYDIARRSFESHMRFGINPSQWESFEGSCLSRDYDMPLPSSLHQPSRRNPRQSAQRVTLHDVIGESYDAQAPSTRFISQTCESVKNGGLSWYLLGGLHSGSCAGMDSGKASMREVLRIGIAGLGIVVALLLLCLY